MRSPSRPRPPELWGTSALLALVAAAAGIWGGLAQPAFAVYCLGVASGPFAATVTSAERATLLAYGVLAWSLFGLAPAVTVGEALGGPYGSHPVVFLGGLVAAVARIRALSSARAAAWCRPRPAS